MLALSERNAGYQFERTADGRLVVTPTGAFHPSCPDAVFEVRSASNTLAELREKMHAYLANGARLAVLIDPESADG